MILKYLFIISLIIVSPYTYAQHHASEQASIAIVLGTSVIDSLPSPAFEQRILHGIQLYQNGIVQKLLFTGGIVHGRKYTEAEVAYIYAINNGIPAQDIIIEDKATNTIENIRLVKLHLDTVSYKNVYLVTDSIHIRRAQLIAKEEKLQVSPSPSSTSFISSNFEKFKYNIRETLYRTLYSMSQLWN